jgi:hypothetical protein
MSCWWRLPNREYFFKPIRRLEDCAGIYSKYGNVEEIEKEIDKVREKY